MEEVNTVTFLKCKGQSFYTFLNSNIFNFYTGNTNASNWDILIRFRLRAKNDLLWIVAKKYNFQRPRAGSDLYIENNRF
jgi:hypothetical protein